MRRAKIRPSINLAASRRTVPSAVAPGDRALKSPAKSVPAPAKTPSSGGTSLRPSRSSVRLSSTEVVQTGQTNIIKLPAAINAGSGSSSGGDVTRDTEKSQAEQATVQHKDNSEQLHTDEPSTSKSSSTASQSATAKNEEPAAPKVPRGRRKLAPNIPNRSRPRQRSTTSTETTSEATKAKEASGQEAQKEDDKRDNAAEKVAADVIVNEPPPVQRVVTSDGAIPSISKAAGRSTITTTAITSKSQQGKEKPSEVQAIQIHRDASSNSKMPAATKSTKATPLRSIGQGEKKNPMNIYERKLRELKETLEEETPAKRRRRYVKKKILPSDRSNMTMSDLIYYNPKDNPMKQGPGTENRDRSRHDSEIVTDINKDASEAEDDEGQDAVDQFVPQVKIGPDGSLILDQQSLVKDASPKKTFDPSDSDVVHEDFSNTTYASFRKRTRTSNWTKKETEKFYKALSAVGTDFSMINAMFPKRTRTQIKNKFKREERSNHLKVDAAIRKTSKVSMSMFAQSEEDSESETENRPTRVKHKSAGKKRHLSGTTANAQNQGEKESQADGTGNTATVVTVTNQSDDNEELGPSENGEEVAECPPQEPRQDVTQSEDSEEDVNMETILSQPTRSGRQPKIRTSFTIEEPVPRVYSRSKSVARQMAKPAKKIASYEQHRLQEKLRKERQGALTSRTEGLPTATTPSSSTVATPSASSNPRVLSNQSCNVQQIIINSPIMQATPSPIKTHIYVINSPDGSQSIVQVPMATTVPTPVGSTGNSPIVIHRFQTNQPVSLNLQNTSTTPLMTVTAQGGATPSQRFVLDPQRMTLTPASSSDTSRTVTSSLGKSPGKHFLVGPPKVQRRPLVSQNNTPVNPLPRSPQVVAQQLQQHQHLQLSAVAADGADLQQNLDGGMVQLSDPVVAQQVDVECYDRMSESGASESGAFVPPISALPKASEHYSGLEQNTDQLMISGLGSEGVSTRDIFDQISYEQGVAAAGHGSVAANMEVAISEDMISQIATEIATEK